MKKNEALAVFNTYILAGAIEPEAVANLALEPRDEVERQLRIISNDDAGFEDMLKELGISTLAKHYMKSVGKEIKGFYDCCVNTKEKEQTH